MNAREVLQAVEGMEPAAQRAYLAQIAGAIDAATLAEVERAIEDGDDDAVMALLPLGLFAGLIELFRTAYIKGGAGEVKGIKAPGIIKELDVNAPDASSFLSGQAKAFIDQSAVDEARAVRAVMDAGRASGQSARKTTLDLIGRVSKQTGKRSGGVVGLSGNFAESVATARTQLSSGDNFLMRQYLTRTRRDRRFDAMVKKSIAEGRTLKADDVNKIVGRYADRLLATQAEMIAQTYVAEAFNEGRDQAWRQIVDRSKGRLTFSKAWKSRGDEKVRNSHVTMNGQTVRADEPFISPRGALLMFPCDSSLGAPLSERARCRCIAEYSVMPVNP
ncbi:phage minor head protein [Pseudomonas prosekii]|uniref:Phage Mu protein F like protein n=1 Tax=Pseudomonas prosekii TaxID=1148509 RepID=A0A1H2B3Q1_9PSED|nr:phage minor head protein [Pseudomonas prosekii]SDT52697.1 Phage Mu protein F like protein [Pseudomonas prosekii]